MTTKIEKLFDALIEQTTQRGGSPSVRDLSNAAMQVQTILMCYTEIREQAVVPGMSRGLVHAIEAMDIAVQNLNGPSGVPDMPNYWPTPL